MRLTTTSVSVIFLLLHFAIAILVPNFDDEAYYALWSRDLALGYYDHPPMIAYFIHLGVQIFGETPLGLRFVSILTVVASGMLVGDMARRLWPDLRSIAPTATLFFHLNSLVFTLGSFATPDAPSLFFWIAALWAALYAIHTEPQSRVSLSWWCVTGLFIGLGVLSKFTNAFLALGLLAYLFGTAKGRVFLQTKFPYLAILAAILPVIPYLLWNIETDWLGLERQSERLSSEQFTPNYLLEYGALLLLAPTPLVTYFAFLGLRTGLRARMPDMAFLNLPALPLFLYFFHHSTHAQVQANWIVPLQGYIALLAAYGLCQIKAIRYGRALSTGQAIVMSFGLFFAAFNPYVPFGQADNPPNQTRGWTATRAEIEQTLKETGATWIATVEYSQTGMLSLQFSEYDVWSLKQLQRYGFRGAFSVALCDAPALFIERTTRVDEFSSQASALFESVGAPRILHRQALELPLMSYVATPVLGVLSTDLCPDAP